MEDTLMLNLGRKNEYILRNLNLPIDYVGMASLFNLIELSSTSPESLESEDKYVPKENSLSKNEDGLLIGFGRERIVAVSGDGQIIGYGAAWRAPWETPGNLASIFCVHPDFRNQGIGENILYHLQQWAIENGAFLIMSELKDWIDNSLSFTTKRGFRLDAHVFDLVLSLNEFDRNLLYFSEVENGVRYTTLAKSPGEESERKLYELFKQTAVDNPGQVGDLPSFDIWRKEALPEGRYNPEWVLIATDNGKFVGVTTLLTTDESGVLYTDYTGVLREYRGKGIAKALKLLSIKIAIDSGAHTMHTESEANNLPMQHLNRSLGYVQGEGHYRIVKEL